MAITFWNTQKKVVVSFGEGIIRCHIHSTLGEKEKNNSSLVFKEKVKAF